MLPLKRSTFWTVYPHFQTPIQTAPFFDTHTKFNSFSHWYKKVFQFLLYFNMWKYVYFTIGAYKIIIIICMYPLSCICILNKVLLEFYVCKTIIIKSDVSNNFRYESAMSTLAGIFGPKANRNFPNVTRLSGGGCGYDGFYPAGDKGGVDLEIDSGETVSIFLLMILVF